jgi:WD40 repeat protein
MKYLPLALLLIATIGCSDGETTVPNDPALIKSFPGPNQRMGHDISIEFSSDGYIITGLELHGSQVDIWTTQGWLHKTFTRNDHSKIKLTSKPDFGSAISVALTKTPKGPKRIACRHGTGEFSVRGLSGERVQTYSVNGEFGCVSFSPDGELLATGCWDSSDDSVAIDIFDTYTHKLLKTLTGERGDFIEHLSFDPSGERIASGHYGKLYIWNIATGELLLIEADNLTFDKQTKIAFSPNGKRIAITNPHGLTTIWDSATGNLDQSIDTDRPGLASGGQRFLALSADWSRMAINDDWSANPQVVQIIDVSTRKVLRTLTGHTRTISGAAFSPDDKTLATCSHDGTIKLWDVSK